jgi:SAM-dependent methyltransferase
MERETIRARQYTFPYHLIPRDEDGYWAPSRILPWGMEYLGLLSAMKQELEALAPSSVVDVGCGDGRLLAELAASTRCELAGVEVDARALRFARAALPDTVSLHQHTSEVASGRFAVGVAMEVLEHVPDAEIQPFLTEMVRLLSSDGALVVSVPTVNRPLNRKHYRHYTLATLQAQVAGIFTVARVRWVHHIGPTSGVLRRLTVNRFFILEYPPLLRLVTAAYRRHVLESDAEHGAHLLAVLRPRVS